MTRRLGGAAAIVAVGVGLVLVFSSAVLQSAPASEADEAYGLNRDAMVDMSEAQFEQAAAKFIRAARIAPDYTIGGRPLLYTPNFMAAWAYEKLGNSEDACRYFRKFLEVAPHDTIESTKADHARDYLRGHCGQ